MQHTVLRVALIARLRVVTLLRVHELLLLLLLHAEVLLLLLRHSLGHLRRKGSVALSEGDTRRCTLWIVDDEYEHFLFLEESND